MYTVSYFIEKFSKIPDELWTVATLNNSGRSCAMGHCGVVLSSHLTEEGIALGRLLFSIPYIYQIFSGEFRKILFSLEYQVVYNINDGHLPKYNQSSPKERILAALNDAKELQQTNIKTIIKYVAVDAPIRQETKQLQLN